MGNLKKKHTVTSPKNIVYTNIIPNELENYKLPNLSLDNKILNPES